MYQRANLGYSIGCGIPTVELKQELGDGSKLFLFGARKNIQLEISRSLKCWPQVKVLRQIQISHAFSNN